MGAVGETRDRSRSCKETSVTCDGARAQTGARRPVGRGRSRSGLSRECRRRDREPTPGSQDLTAHVALNGLDIEPSGLLRGDPTSSLLALLHDRGGDDDIQSSPAREQGSRVGNKGVDSTVERSGHDARGIRVVTQETARERERPVLVHVFLPEDHEANLAQELALEAIAVVGAAGGGGGGNRTRVPESPDSRRLRV